MTTDSTSGEDQTRVLGLPAIDLSSIITRTLDAAREDAAQLRNAIYELARVKLQKEAWAMGQQHEHPRGPAAHAGAGDRDRTGRDGGVATGRIVTVWLPRALDSR